jgi:hypothetical protein
MAVYLARRSSLVIFGFGPPLRFRRWGDDDDDDRLLLLASSVFDVDFIVLLLITSMAEFVLVMVVENGSNINRKDRKRSLVH